MAKKADEILEMFFKLVYQYIQWETSNTNTKPDFQKCHDAMDEYNEWLNNPQFQNSPKWVRASERVPHEGAFFIRNVETKSGSMVYSSEIKQMDGLENIEWLDETPGNVSPKGGENMESLRQLFKNNTNCYADTWSQDGLGAPMVEGDSIPAMTEKKFIEVVAAHLSPVVKYCKSMGHYGGSHPDGKCPECGENWNRLSPVPVVKEEENKTTFKKMDMELDLVHECLTELYNIDAAVPIIKECLSKIEKL